MDTPLSIRSDCEVVSGPPVNHVGKRNGFSIVRVVLGVLLLAAAGLKFADGDFGAADGFGPLASPFWRLAVVESEVLLGVWLLLGLAPRVLWLVALLFFSVLAGASLYLGIEGQPSCGCFGAKLPVRPWYSFLLDLTSVAALGWWRPQYGNVSSNWRVRSVHSHSFRLASSALLFMLAAVPASVAIFGSTPAILTDEGDIIGDNSTVVLEPENWIGKRFPLLKHTDIGSQLMIGRWIVVLYRPDCPRCREELARYERRVCEEAWTMIMPRIAVIDVSGGNEERRAVGGGNSWCLCGRLSGARKWFVRPPVILRIEDGYVKGVERDGENIERPVGNSPPQ